MPCVRKANFMKVDSDDNTNVIGYAWAVCELETVVQEINFDKLKIKSGKLKTE